jgi:hypothetical protein
MWLKDDMMKIIKLIEEKIAKKEVSNTRFESDDSDPDSSDDLKFTVCLDNLLYLEEVTRLKEFEAVKKIKEKKEIKKENLRILKDALKNVKEQLKVTEDARSRKSFVLLVSN